MLNFLPHPGPRERQLQRKATNPLLANRLPEIQQSDIEQARQGDQNAMEQFLVEFRQVVEKTAGLDSRIEADDILKIKAELEHIYPQACGMMGDNNVFKDALNKLIAAISQSLLSAAGDDQESVSRIIEDQEHAQLHLKISENLLVSDLLNPEDIIPKEELVATLLNAHAESLSAALLIFGPEQLQDIIQEAEAMIESKSEVSKQHPHIISNYQQLLSWSSGLDAGS